MRENSSKLINKFPRVEIFFEERMLSSYLQSLEIFLTSISIVEGNIQNWN
jgi:hypothetical protein